MKQYPFLWITIAYMSGVILNEIFEKNPGDFFNIAYLLFFLVFLYFLKGSFSTLFASIFLLTLLTSWTRSGNISNYHRINSQSAFTKNDHKFIGIINAKKLTGNFIKVEMDLLGSDCDCDFPPKILAYLKNDNKNQIQIKDTVVFKAKFSEIPANSNPHSFDYKKFMAKKYITYQAFIRTVDYDLIPFKKEWTGLSLLNELNTKLSLIIDEHFTNKENASLLKAISLGNKTSLSKSTLEEFSNTGSRHILAVSGMHVGIILTLLMKLFGFIPVNLIAVRILRDLGILLLIWMYGFLTGAQPAVLRACFMLSVLFVGKMIGKSSFSLNTLFFTGFVMLVLDPNLLFQISFIFSYTAMLSIFLFYKSISKLLYIKNRWLRYIWQILALSMSAQILMLPLATFYFHKIPMLFLISGLITTPLAFLLIIFVVVFFVDFFTFKIIFKPVTELLDLLSSFFLNSIKYLDKLTFGTIDNVYIDFTALCILLLATVGITAGIKHHIKYFIYIGICISVFFIFRQGFNSFLTAKTTSLIVYEDSKSTFIDLFWNRTCYSWTSSNSSFKDSEFSAKGNRIFHRVRSIIQLNNEIIDTDAFDYNSNTFQFLDNTIFILSDSEFYLPVFDTIELFIIDHYDLRLIKQISEKYKIKKVVVTKRIKGLNRKSIVKLFNQSIVWDISRQGAFIFPINQQK